MPGAGPVRSMENFCAELKELNPSLDITMTATEAEQGIVKPNKSIPVPESETDDALYRKLKKFKHKMLSGEPQMAALFTDVERAKAFIDPYEFADDLYHMTSDMYCLPELKLDFTDLFGEEGMIDGFRAYNASWCLWEGLMPGARQSWLRRTGRTASFWPRQRGAALLLCPGLPGGHRGHG